MQMKLSVGSQKNTMARMISCRVEVCRRRTMRADAKKNKVFIAERKEIKGRNDDMNGKEPGVVRV